MAIIPRNILRSSQCRLRLLVDTARRVRAGGGALAVVAPPPCLRKLVRLNGIKAELPLVATARQGFHPRL